MMKFLFSILLFFCFVSVSFGQQMQEFNQLYAEADKAKGVAASDEAVDKVNALPSFTDLLGKNVLLPQIALGGITNFEQKKDAKQVYYGTIKVFTSALSQKQSSNATLFFQESSAYGISMSFNYLPSFLNFKNEREYKDVQGEDREAKWVCTYLNLNYLGKNLYGVKEDNGKKDTTSFTSDVAHVKVGLQVIPIKNILSFYADVNFLQAVVNRDPLIEHNPPLANGFTNYWNFGTKFFLANGADKPLKVFVDFSFTLADRNTRTIYTTNDAWIPRLSIGGTATF